MIRFSADQLDRLQKLQREQDARRLLKRLQTDSKVRISGLPDDVLLRRITAFLQAADLLGFSNIDQGYRLIRLGLSTGDPGHEQDGLLLIWNVLVDPEIDVDDRLTFLETNFLADPGNP